MMFSATSMSTKTRHSFLLLPPEIRNLIYNLALVDAGNLTLRYGSYHNPFDKPRDVPQPLASREWSVTSTYGTSELHPRDGNLSPNLLATNKQVHSEANAILYGQTLHFSRFCALYDFLDHIVGSNLVFLRDVFVHDDGYPLCPAPRNLGELCNHVHRLRWEIGGWNANPYIFSFSTMRQFEAVDRLFPKDMELRERFMQRRSFVWNSKRFEYFSRTWTRSEEAGMVVEVDDVV
ncbi:hypothetical protein BDV97DRAFT_201439 [Delphinella strobiligena]|nr:hypothetical protein BDV97DRAFT_201439 [Delphinella strobiligena]